MLTLFKIIATTRPGWFSGRASTHEPRSHPLDSWSGHMPGLLAQSSVGAVQEAADQYFSLIDELFLSSPLSKIHKNIFKIIATILIEIHCKTNRWKPPNCLKMFC